MTPVDCGMRNAECGMKRGRLLLLALVAALPLAAGCRQKMAEQPYYRPLEEATFFDDDRASRPLQPGVIHRVQRLESDPIVTGLTAEEWGRAYEFGLPMKIDAPPLTDVEKIRRAVGAPRYSPTAGQPKVYVTEYPFEITPERLKRGQQRYTIYCAVCHGPLGNGQGKIWERGYLTPTSFHTKKVAPDEVTVSNPQGLGISRGYSLWGHTVPMDQVPVGYIFEVITHGYGGMPSYSAQISPEDRWLIIAYVRALQYTQTAPGKQPDAAGGKK
jgi:mono/diheme cytochrome c family protein